MAFPKENPAKKAENKKRIYLKLNIIMPGEAAGHLRAAAGGLAVGVAFHCRWWLGGSGGSDSAGGRARSLVDRSKSRR